LLSATKFSVVLVVDAVPVHPDCRSVWTGRARCLSFVVNFYRGTGGRSVALASKMHFLSTLVIRISKSMLKHKSSCSMRIASSPWCSLPVRVELLKFLLRSEFSARTFSCTRCPAVTLDQLEGAPAWDSFCFDVCVRAVWQRRSSLRA
jgi:hypothetical protein